MRGDAGDVDDALDAWVVRCDGTQKVRRAVLVDGGELGFVSRFDQPRSVHDDVRVRDGGRQ